MLAFLGGAKPYPPAVDHRECWVVLADGSEVLVRTAVPEDRPAVAAMHERCSAHSRYLRYLAATPRMPGWVLDRLVGGDRGVALVAVAPGGAIIGLANLMPAAASERTGHGDGPATAEAALLVEDAWQGKRLGTMLFRRLVALGSELALAEVSATVLPSNARMWRLLRRAGLAEEADGTGGALLMHGMLENVRATISSPTLAGSAV
jgi:RimJ/RimL family protein N-acetyltransferase